MTEKSFWRFRPLLQTKKNNHPLTCRGICSPPMSRQPCLLLLMLDGRRIFQSTYSTSRTRGLLLPPPPSPTATMTTAERWEAKKIVVSTTDKSSGEIVFVQCRRRVRDMTDDDDANALVPEIAPSLPPASHAARRDGKKKKKKKSPDYGD